MNRKTTLSTAIGLVLGGATLNVSASLTTSATLNFTLGTQQVVSCAYGTTPPCDSPSYNITDIVGSYFGFDTNTGTIDPNEKTPIGSFNGIHIGTIQVASGSHAGGINGTENPNIDNPWTFFGGTGMHQTTSPIIDLTGTGSVRVLDFSGWEMILSTFSSASIPLTETAPTTITCNTTSCSDSSNYTIDGAFHFAGSGLTTITYTLHLEGTVSNVPIPATVWLFGSGLIGLMGVARRKKVA